MERKRLACELTDFCIAYRILGIPCGARELEQRIERQLDDVVFVETLINLIIVKAKNHRGINKDKLIEVLSELERVRLELEYRVPERAGKKC